MNRNIHNAKIVLLFKKFSTVEHQVDSYSRQVDSYSRQVDSYSRQIDTKLHTLKKK